MIELAEKELCTGCGACAYVCPKSCITMRENETGIIYPAVDDADCISCRRCENTCPILVPVELHAPEKAYAAWSRDEGERRTSASGGVAIELYKQALTEGCQCVGASQNADFSVTHKLASTADELRAFKNSKYVFSDLYDVLPRIRESLRRGDKVCFIGLPCQVAALRKMFRDDERLLTVDLICHGTTPVAYLRRHIAEIAGRYGKSTSGMSFRDPAMGTQTYTFTLYDGQGRLYYAGRTKDGDSYQFGYHRAVSYRENCYHCRFARSERTSDLTIGDYHGLGAVLPCTFPPDKVSVILVNTAKGRSFVGRLQVDARIAAVERPLQEPLQHEPQLRHPSVKNKFRLLFEKEIAASHGDFETAIARPQKRYRRAEAIHDFIRLPFHILRGFKNKIIR
ncbi:MAG: Coenzyme F420 hydrogenase/dehydrogenase, beta subunit C-terminal domain [Paraprevotella sp.]|nr:Coenzyme F420 hydrogenase/dehydrogenase, beta subunit C-terminal domain [Paraprevotella sp.]